MVHIHILVSAPPNLAPSEIMRRVKGRTSSKLFKEFLHVKRQYWGRLFLCYTVRQMIEEMIKEYLAHHFKPKQDDTFEVEPD